MHSDDIIQKLHFSLPPFKRMAWVSDAAQLAWSTTIKGLAEICLQVKIQMLTEGHFQCIVLQLAAWEYLKIKESLKNRGLDYSILETINAYEPGKISSGFVKPVFFKIAIGYKENVASFERAYHSNDINTCFTLLDMPECCKDFSRRKARDQGWNDLAWFRALNTSGHEQKIYSAYVRSSPQLNLFWQALELTAVCYQPCSFACKDSEAAGKRFFDTGESMGLRKEMEALKNVLSWPVEWTAVHGIAEIKTPVLRISTNTDATAEKLVVQIQSAQYPQEGAKGLNFPFQPPGFKRITASRSFQMGLNNEIKIL